MTEEVTITYGGVEITLEGTYTHAEPRFGRRNMEDAEPSFEIEDVYCDDVYELIKVIAAQSKASIGGVWHDLECLAVEKLQKSKAA